MIVALIFSGLFNLILTIALLSMIVTLIEEDRKEAQWSSPV